MKENAWASRSVLLCSLALLMATPFLLNWDPMVSLAVRMVVFVPVILWWRLVVDAAIATGLIHAMRRKEVKDFRWRMLAIVLLVEFLLIQQLPALVFRGFAD